MSVTRVSWYLVRGGGCRRWIAAAALSLAALMNINQQCMVAHWRIISSYVLSGIYPAFLCFNRKYWLLILCDKVWINFDQEQKNTEACGGWEHIKQNIVHFKQWLAVWVSVLSPPCYLSYVHTRFSGNFIFSFHKKPAQTCFCLMVLLIGTNNQQKGGSMWRRKGEGDIIFELE